MPQPRTRITAIAFALLGFVIGPTVRAAPIDCAKAPDGIEKTICDSAQLVADDRELAEAFDMRHSQCPPRKRAALEQSQKFWLRDRNACWNLVSETAGPVRQCVARRIDERERQLDRIGTSCDLDAVADQYRYVDPDYLLANASRYIGKEVWVWGDMQLSNCSPHSSDVRGKLRANPKAPAFPARFKAMPVLEREFLCNQRPSSHWHGMVRRDKSGTYLYLTDVLGAPL